MTADRVGPLAGHVVGHSVTVVVVCGFIGCDWKMEIGTAPLEAHNAYLDHLDVHDVDVASDPQYAGEDHSDCSCGFAIGCPTDNCDQEDGEEVEHDGHETEAEALDCPVCRPQMGLYAGDTAEDIAAGQARVDRFMAGGGDQ